MTLRRQTGALSGGNAAFALWIDRGMEALWLLAVVLVPLVFFGRDYALSEAVIAYVEVPKVALLHTLAGLMAVLWLVEWAARGGASATPRTQRAGARLQPSKWVTQLGAWLRSQPTCWVILAVWFFLGTTILSTALSGSVAVSLWGEIPGQDSYNAYTIASYVVLFGAIASHLKTRLQLWRLLGALVTAGTLISGYAVLQHFGHDFLDLTEYTGGGQARVTSTMGNAVFSASAMSMPITITLLMATMTLREPTRGTGKRRSKVSAKAAALAAISLWATVLAVQLLGMIFTFSRGPWVGTLCALVAFLGLVGWLVGWRFLGRAALVLGLAAALTLAVAEWPTAVALLGLAGFLGLLAAFAMWGVARAAPVLGAGAAAAVVAVLAILLLAGGVGTGGDQPSPPASASASVGSQVEARFTSITSELTEGVLGGRVAHWKDSWQLIRHRPWFEFDTLSFRWLRPLIGYGPDLFRYTYLLVTLPSEGNSILVEPDHAHNYFIHQTVEQGILGALSALGLFVAAFAACGYLLLQKRADLLDLQKLLLVGVLATLVGRFVEQMVGVARISDLTMFWAILGTLCAAPPALSEPALAARPAPRPDQMRRRRPPPPTTAQESAPQGWKFYLRLAIVAWAIGGILTMTWVKSLDYPRGAVMAGAALEDWNLGDPQAALAGLDQAIELAPDVPVYYSFRAEVYTAYRKDPKIAPEKGCSQQTVVTYDVCLAQMVYFSNLAAVEHRPFYWRSRLALADSAFLLKLDDEAIRRYQEVVALIPASAPFRNRLAEAYIAAGQPEGALKAVADSLAITGEATANAADGLFLQGTAYRDLGRLAESAQSLERSLALGLAGRSAQSAQEMLAKIRSSPGEPGTPRQ